MACSRQSLFHYHGPLRITAVPDLFDAHLLKHIKKETQTEKTDVLNLYRQHIHARC